MLGQSYGGFCITTYLSYAPHALDVALITGGLPPLVDEPDAVYHATHRHVLAKMVTEFAAACRTKVYAGCSSLDFGGGWTAMY